MSDEPISATLTRVVDAPRELVWKAWTDPEHVARWWGPGGVTVREVVEPERIVFTEPGPDGIDDVTCDVTFTDLGSDRSGIVCRLTIRARPENGWVTSAEYLAELLTIDRAKKRAHP